MGWLSGALTREWHMYLCPAVLGVVQTDVSHFKVQFTQLWAAVEREDYTVGQITSGNVEGEVATHPHSDSVLLCTN